MQNNQNIQSPLDTLNIHDEDILNNLLDNPEEKIVFNCEEIDEDELEEDYEQETNNEQNKQYNEIINEENKSPNEENENFNQTIKNSDKHINESQTNMRSQQPNRKYQDFYQFIMNQETNEITDMEVRKYDNYDAKIMSMLIQNKLTCNKQAKIAGLCNTNTYSLNKGILKYEMKGKQAVNKELSQL